ncbi:MAG: ABC transporter permease [Turicibacter sp.]
MAIWLNDINRAFSKKSFWFSLASIPLMVSLMAFQSLKANTLVSSSYLTTVETFALYTPRHKIFTLYLFSMVILFVVTAIAQEFESGEIRFILMRGVSCLTLFWVKYITIMIQLVIFIITYVGCSYVIGGMFFEKGVQIESFLSEELLSSNEVFNLTVAYYVLVFVILAVFALLVAAVGIVTKSAILTTTLSLVFVLISMGYFVFISLLYSYGLTFFGLTGPEANLLSLVLMQLKGIYEVLGGSMNLFRFGAIVLIGYSLISGGIASYLTLTSDQFL